MRAEGASWFVKKYFTNSIRGGLSQQGATFIAEVRSQKSEVRSQKSEVRSQKSEVRSQKQARTRFRSLGMS
ncbi:MULTISPECIES: hypothetical protein [unclassified Moorena]|uniref:hypothetical protein n=1 Tax=unclassified Moorena TaxID=2683338 RepID=UPI0013BCC3EE|nr:MULTISPECIES: hypothetical protein [unclassified Moorena]NEQ15097.1 hypothetical protein [Moorena sp. SIO3E2]NEP30588.1 hypothetical protein [Moorena sp. SIO3B2]NEQ04978.1 hypothetical protein [Moorena sp. SIO4E2]NER91820.1 hypothetical protein [Moorena sp. SIO3A2]NES44606.1 hypothetical protein [Moorena sp. SIO2C4]